MATIFVDGVEYAPKCTIPELSDDRLRRSLAELTAVLYFKESHKAMAHVWDVLNILAPDVAKIAANNPEMAFHMFHKEDVDVN